MLKTIIIVLICVLAFMLIPQIVQSDSEVNPVMETQVPIINIVKTFDSEVTRLALKYGQSEKLARKIISCEGKLYKVRGNNINYTKSGVAWSVDVGWWQINDYYHKKTAIKRGLNIYNEWDNLEYGFWLLKTQGTPPWSASKKCWSK